MFVSSVLLSGGASCFKVLPPMRLPCFREVSLCVPQVWIASRSAFCSSYATPSFIFTLSGQPLSQKASRRASQPRRDPHSIPFVHCAAVKEARAELEGHSCFQLAYDFEELFWILKAWAGKFA